MRQCVPARFRDFNSFTGTGDGYDLGILLRQLSELGGQHHRGQEGTVVDTNGSLIMVSLDDGRHVDSYTASQLERAW